MMSSFLRTALDISSVRERIVPTVSPRAKLGISERKLLARLHMRGSVEGPYESFMAWKVSMPVFTSGLCNSMWSESEES